MIGSLGEFKFEASSHMIKTFTDLAQTSKVRYGSHDTLQGKPKLEYTGTDLDELNLKLFFRAEDKVNPEKEISYFIDCMNKGEVLLFLLGSKKVGNGNYVITDIKKAAKRIDNRGNILASEYDISLKEYYKEPKKAKENKNKSKKNINKLVKKVADTSVKSIPYSQAALGSKNPIIKKLGLTGVAVATTGLALESIFNKPKRK